MIDQPGFLLSALAFMVVIGPLVFVHELGHYAVGRWFGVHAEEFSIGFGRELFGLTDKRGTRWKFGWLPLGGYVKFAGDMNAVSQPSAEWLSLPPAERQRTFPSKPVWQRALIVAAGPMVNLLLAVLVLAGFAIAYGDSVTPSVVREVAPGSAAARAGLVPGDRITAMGGRAVDSFDDLVRFVSIRPGETVPVTIERGGRTASATATIGVRTDRDRFGNEYQVGLLGVGSAEPVYRPVPLLEAPGIAVRNVGRIMSMMVDTVGQIITGRRSVSELGGPLRIAKVAGEQFTVGVPEFVFLVALISINLGFINLLPVPMLDGGHLLFYAIEAVRRRPVGPEVQEWAFRGGLVALLALMLLVTFNDLGAFGLWQNLAGLIG